jgi:hypothetical protein
MKAVIVIIVLPLQSVTYKASSFKDSAVEHRAVHYDLYILNTLLVQ